MIKCIFSTYKCIVFTLYLKNYSANHFHCTHFLCINPNQVLTGEDEEGGQQKDDQDPSPGHLEDKKLC